MLELTTNPNQQKLIYKRRKGVYVMRCLPCGNSYETRANVATKKKCPACQK